MLGFPELYSQEIPALHYAELSWSPKCRSQIHRYPNLAQSPCGQISCLLHIDKLTKENEHPQNLLSTLKFKAFIISAVPCLCSHFYPSWKIWGKSQEISHLQISSEEKFCSSFNAVAAPRPSLLPPFPQPALSPCQGGGKERQYWW